MLGTREGFRSAFASDDNPGSGAFPELFDPDATRPSGAVVGVTSLEKHSKPARRGEDRSRGREARNRNRKKGQTALTTTASPRQAFEAAAERAASADRTHRAPRRERRKTSADGKPGRTSLQLQFPALLLGQRRASSRKARTENPSLNKPGCPHPISGRLRLSFNAADR